MTIKQHITKQLENILKEVGVSDVSVVVDYPSDSKNGDYATNVALVAAKKAQQNPMELAEKIADHFKEDENVTVSVARPGFINFSLTDAVLQKTLHEQTSTLQTTLSGKKLLVEFAHPNTHKVFHIGHLRNITTGEAVVRLLTAGGADVVRCNYQGDVGMHIAKALYGILSHAEYHIDRVGNDARERVAFLGKAYAAGNKAFEEDDDAKKEILKINKQIYAKDSEIYELYRTTRQWSLDYFELIYKRVGSTFDRYYFESEVYESGKETVHEGLKKGIFEKSDGAIIFPGSKVGLHDRVFITQEGNPTYEGKEMGLGPLQFKENHPDKVIHVVGPEQEGYFQVVFAALAQLFPETKNKEQHLVYGWVKLKHGKMSSRTGNVILGEWLLDEAKKKISESYEVSEHVAEQIAVAAVKYSFLKVSLNQEIAFDLDESISLEGNSGPYLQYTFARTQSVLGKAEELHFTGDYAGGEPEEKQLLRLLTRFPDLIAEAAERLAPNIVCTYLFELAQAFNLFYQKHQILKADDPEKQFRLALTKATGETLKKGLSLLGIEAPEKM